MKHGTRLRVFNLHGDTLGNAQVPQKFRQRKTARATKLWTTVIPLVLVIFAIAVALLYYRSHQSKPLTDKDRDCSRGFHEHDW